VLSTSAGDSDSAGLAESAPTKEAIPCACTSLAGASGRADGGRSANAGWRWRCGGGAVVRGRLGWGSGAERRRHGRRGGGIHLALRAHALLAVKAVKLSSHDKVDGVAAALVAKVG
jgi:hypothetical protein